MFTSRISRTWYILAILILPFLAACSPKAVIQAPPPPATVLPLPAGFKTGNITADPPMVLLGQLTWVGVVVTNTGEQADNATVTMYFDGTPLKSQNITLAAGESQNVTFPLSSSHNGTHLIQIGDSAFNLMVHIFDPNLMGGMGSM